MLLKLKETKNEIIKQIEEIADENDEEFEKVE
jgi:hypothetical protein